MLSVHRFYPPRILHRMQKPCGDTTRLCVFLKYAFTITDEDPAMQAVKEVGSCLDGLPRDILTHDGTDAPCTASLEVFSDVLNKVYEIDRNIRPSIALHRVECNSELP